MILRFSPDSRVARIELSIVLATIGDREYEGHLELLFRDIDLFGSHPFIRYEYTDVSSNIGLFDYDRHEFSVGVRAINW